MEILSTHTDTDAYIIVCLILTAIGIFLILGAIGGYISGELVLPTVLLLVGLLFLASWWALPIHTYHDAIVTDWNEVYSQGYEVVETNGQIVTLRKVGE